MGTKSELLSLLYSPRKAGFHATCHLCRARRSCRHRRSIPCAAPPSPTFTKDVAPIVYNSCVSCHRPGEVAPMSLISYEDVRPWARSIQHEGRRAARCRRGAPIRATASSRRPQPQPDADRHDRDVGRRRRAERQRRRPAGRRRRSRPAGRTASPTLVLEMPIDFEIPAEGEVLGHDFFSKVPLTEDVYVKALEIRPGTPGVVHHAGVYVIDRLPDGATLVERPHRRRGAASRCRGTRWRAANGGTSTEEIQKLLSFVPGRGFESYQGDVGQLHQGRLVHRLLHALHADRQAREGPDEARLYLAKQGQEVSHQIFHSFSAAGPTTYIVEGQPYAPQRQKRDDPNSVEGGVNLPNIPPYAENWKVVSITRS